MARGVEAQIVLGVREEEEDGLWAREVGEVGFWRAEWARNAAKKFAKKGRLVVGIVGWVVVARGVVLLCLCCRREGRLSTDGSSARENPVFITWGQRSLVHCKTTLRFRGSRSCHCVQ